MSTKMKTRTYQDLWMSIISTLVGLGSIVMIRSSAMQERLANFVAYINATATLSGNQAMINYSRFMGNAAHGLSYTIQLVLWLMVAWCGYFVVMELVRIIAKKFFHKEIVFWYMPKQVPDTTPHVECAEPAEDASEDNDEEGTEYDEGDPLRCTDPSCTCGYHVDEHFIDGEWQ